MDDGKMNGWLLSQQYEHDKLWMLDDIVDLEISQNQTDKVK